MMQYDGEDVQQADDTMTGDGWLRQRCDELEETCLKLNDALKASRAETERARKSHGEASATAYRLGQENDAMIVTIRVLSKELEQWKR